MKKNLLILVLLISSFLYSQQKKSTPFNLYNYDKFVRWSKTYDYFDLKDFEIDEKIEITTNNLIFDNDRPLKKAPDYIKKLFIFSPNKKMYVDLYRDYGILKKGNKFYIDPDCSYQTYLNIIPTNKTIVVFNRGMSTIIDAFWVDDNTIILLGSGYGERKDGGFSSAIISKIDLTTLTITQYINNIAKENFIHYSRLVDEMDLKEYSYEEEEENY